MLSAPVRLLAALVVLAPLSLSGCYQQAIIDAIVQDPDLEPGGAVEAMLGDSALGAIPALAKGEPLTIHGQSHTVLFAITLGADVGGRPARDVLMGAGRTLSLTITPSSATQMQFHAGGASCNADAGQIDLSAGLNMALSGSFAATGRLAGTETPCELSGTITAIPLYR